MLLDGAVVGALERSNPRALPLPNVFGNGNVRPPLSLPLSCPGDLYQQRDVLPSQPPLHLPDPHQAASIPLQLQLSLSMPAQRWQVHAPRDARKPLCHAACAGMCAQVTLDILVSALGRVNFGCVWDYKGLTSPDIRLNGAALLFSPLLAPDYFAHMHACMALSDNACLASRCTISKGVVLTACAASLHATALHDCPSGACCVEDEGDDRYAHVVPDQARCCAAGASTRCSWTTSAPCPTAAATRASCLPPMQRGPPPAMRLGQPLWAPSSTGVPMSRPSLSQSQ